MKVLLFSILCLTSPLLVRAQTICTINANSNWSTCTCVETGLAPVNGNTVVVSAGKTLTINVSTAPFFIGNINVFGILDANKTGAELDGNIHVFSGGTLQLDKQLSLGSAGGCGYTVSIDNGGSMTIPGSGGSALLSICGVGVAQAGGSCSTYPTGAPPYCTPGGGWPGTGFILNQNGNGGIDYTWKGTTTNWTTSTNWTPTRSTPTTADILIFNATGTNKNITSIPTETEASILVTGSSIYSFSPASTPNTLTLSSTTGNALQIDNGSSLTIGNSPNQLNLTMASGSTAQIGGLLTINASFLDVSSATLLLHTSASPLASVSSGKIKTDASTTLKFGTAGFTAGNITLPSSIFNGGTPSISSLVMNTASATLGLEPITVNSATFTLGILNTNSTGSINFSSTATNPTESTTSYISGYAIMNSRAVGAGALTFLGFSMAAGSNVGSMTITRKTGSVAGAIQTFPPSAQSIASTWVITSTIVPAAARTFSFLWQSPFDNTDVATNKFQTYINTGSGFTTIGALQNLAAQGPPRQSATVSTTLLNASFTLADQNNILPITLLYFTGEPEPGKVHLSWATASELNFDYFDLDKSDDGKIFHNIARIKGNGTTNERHDYSFDDSFPFIGKNYYRLTSVDFDNYRETFNVIVKEYSGEKDFQVSPNPSDGQTITLNFNFDSKEGQVVVYDNMGSIVDSFQVNETGQVSFINTLRNGIYFAKYSSPSFTKAIRFLVKQ